METRVDFVNGVQFRVVTRGHEVVCDQPRDNGGEDTGMTPPEFLLAALGSCAAYYAAEYLRTRNQSREGLSVRVTAEKSPAPPARLSTFRIEVDVPGLNEPRHVEGVERAVKRCLIHNTLLHSPEIAITVEAPVTI